MGAALGGPCLIGRLVSTSDGDWPRLTLAYEVPGRDGADRTVERRVDYSGFSRVTGEPSPVSAALKGIKLGTWVCVKVFMDVHPGGSKNGKTYDAFVTLRAVDVFDLNDVAV